MELSKKEFKQLKDGSNLIFEKLYSGYKNKVYNYLYQKTGGNSALTDELFSDVFFSAYKSVNKLKNSRNLLNWLIQISNYRFYDYLRKAYRDKKKLDKIKAKIWHSTDILDSLKSKERMAFIDIAIEELKQSYKDVIRLRYKENKKINEIALIFNKNINAIEVLLTRARKALKQQVDKLIEEGIN